MDKPIDIYLAVPYSDPSQAVREARYDAVTELYARLCREGFVVYSPITHSHVAAVRHGLPTDADYWNRFNLAFLRCSREFWTYGLDGWNRSAGLEWERNEAARLAIPDVFVHPSTVVPQIALAHLGKRQRFGDGAPVAGDGFLPALEGGGHA